MITTLMRDNPNKSTKKKKKKNSSSGSIVQFIDENLLCWLL